MQAAQVAAILTYTARAARRLNLNVAELAALEHLQGAGHLTPTQLGARLAMSSGAVTALIDRLTAAGYAERRPNPHDRRSAIVHPTRAGTDEARRRLAPLAADLGQLVDGLSVADRSVVGRYLAAVTDVIDRHARDEPVPVASSRTTAD